jgi:hypothetical protein
MIKNNLKLENKVLKFQLVRMKDIIKGIRKPYSKKTIDYHKRNYKEIRFARDVNIIKVIINKILILEGNRIKAEAKSKGEAGRN